MSAKSNLLKFLELSNIKKAAFYKATGFSNGFLDKGENISSENIEVIIRVYPELNLNWLITGNGEMRLESKAKNTVTATDRSQVIIGDNNSVDHSNNKKEIVENNSSAEIDLLKAKIASLERELQQKDETIKAKDETLQLYKQLISKN